MYVHTMCNPLPHRPMIIAQVAQARPETPMIATIMPPRVVSGAPAMQVIPAFQPATSALEIPRSVVIPPVMMSPQVLTPYPSTHFVQLPERSVPYAPLLSPPAALVLSGEVQEQGVQEEAQTGPNKVWQRNRRRRMQRRSRMVSVDDYDDDEPPVLEDDDAMGAASPEHGAAKREDITVVVAVGVAVDANIDALKTVVEQKLRRTVVAQFGLWNRGSVLFEVTPRVSLPYAARLGIDSHGCFLMVSNKGSIEVTPESRSFNLRFFLMEPNQDYNASPEQLDAASKLTEAKWVQRGFSDHSQTVADIVEAAKGIGSMQWESVRHPNTVFNVAELHTARRRKYAQVVVACNCVEEARAAAATLEASVVNIGHYRGVFRVSFFRSRNT
eukprot:Hpha_TRINITY_DN13134_c0_g2::TRINITY_DN13134_c0_g2_i1::g.113803::m.113803